MRLLDAALGGGVYLGEYVVVGARASHGKTALGLQWALTAAGAGWSVLVISEEMQPYLIGSRLTAYHYGPKGVRDEETRDAREADNIVFLHHLGSMHMVTEAVRHFADTGGVSVVVVDYLQLLARGTDEYAELSRISRELRALCVTCRVTVIALAQLNRGAEQEPPRSAHLKGSGQIEQDADVVLLLEHPARSQPAAYSNAPDLYRIHVAKRRSGPIVSPVIETTFDLANQRIGQR